MFNIDPDPDRFYDPDLDVDSDGAIGAVDFNFFRQSFGLLAGPSMTDCGASGCLDE